MREVYKEKFGLERGFNKYNNLLLMFKNTNTNKISTNFSSLIIFPFESQNLWVRAYIYIL